MIYGYVRISTPKQDINRQIRNILKFYPEAIIISEVYSGRKTDRPEWIKLFNKVNSNDTIVFDSVSRLSRTAGDGVKRYMELFERATELIQGV